MKRAVLVCLLLAGCQTVDDRNLADAKYFCQSMVAKGKETDFNGCVRQELHNYEILSRFTPPPAQAATAAPVYYPQPIQNDAPVLTPPLANSPMRCQSVPSGLGTLQTTCR